MSEDRLLSSKEVAAILGIAPRTVRRRCEDGDLRHLRIGKLIKIPESALNAYMRRVRRGKRSFTLRHLCVAVTRALPRSDTSLRLRQREMPRGTTRAELGGDGGQHLWQSPPT
jgi:excisionase family DNA binding protein